MTNEKTTNQSEVPGAEAANEAEKRYPHMDVSPSGAISSVKYNEHADTARQAFLSGASWAVGENARLREALEKIARTSTTKDYCHQLASKALLPTPPIKNKGGEE